MRTEDMLYKQIHLHVAIGKKMGFTFYKPMLIGRDYVEGKF